MVWVLNQRPNFGGKCEYRALRKVLDADDRFLLVNPDLKMRDLTWNCISSLDNVKKAAFVVCFYQHFSFLLINCVVDVVLDIKFIVMHLYNVQK